MTHLRIEQSTSGNEYVTSDVIHKLYETAKGILDEEALNEVEESQVSLQGSLVVPKAYGDEIDWLEAKFPDLHITAGARYIRFTDDAVYARLSLYLGDGTGITSSEITNANIFSSSNDSNTGYPYFRGNTSITSFDELGLLPLVTTIPGEAFRDTSNLTSIDLSNVTSVGNGAFQNCTALTTADLSSCTTIGSTVFSGCTNLTSVTLPNTAIDILYDTFRNCSKLTSIGVSNITSVDGSAFSGCTSLTSIDLSNVTSIGNNAFLNCTSLVISNLNASNLTTLGVAAFSGTKIGQISNLGTITKIDIEVFKNCTTLTSVVLPSTVTELCLRSFSGCSLLSTINLDNIESVTGYGGMLDSYTFDGCSSLTSVSLPKCTNLALYGTFNGCTNLKILVAPNVTDVNRGSGSFYNCSHLKGIFFPKLSFNNMTGSNYWAPGFLSDGMSSLVIIDMGNVGMMSKYTVSRFPALRAFVIRNTTTIPTLDDSGDSAFSNVTFFVDDNLLSTYQQDSSWANVRLDTISNLNLSNYLDSDLLQIYNDCITASLS